VTVVDKSSFDRRESPAGARAMRVPARLQQRAVALIFLVAFGAAKGSKRGSDGSDVSDFSPLGKRAGGVVFMVTYHKTGYFLGGQLRHFIASNHLGQDLPNTLALEWDASGASQTTARWETTDGVRTPVMVCPKQLKPFLHNRKVLQEKAWVSNTTSVLQTVRPMLACDDYAGGELPRVALMYRDPFNQVISSYNYHAQVPTPEGWIRNYMKPVMPSEHAASQAAQQSVADRLGIPNINLTRAAQLHGDLITSAHAPNYEEALHTLSAEDGLRMEAARFLCWRASRLGGFGDILSMAANLVPVRRQFDSEIFMMEDWISPDDNVKVATVRRFLSLVCGDGECKDVATRSRVAAAFVRRENSRIEKGGNHITHTSHTNDEHAAQEAVLKADPVLGPLLSYFRCLFQDGSVDAYDVCCFGEPDGKC